MRHYLAVVAILVSLSLSAGRIKPLKITHQVGDVPTLPAMVWNGQSWMQVKWLNYTAEEERREANLPEGSQYEIKGIVLGTGDSIVAKIRTEAKSTEKGTHSGVRMLPLSDVELTGQSVLTQNRDRDVELLLSLDLSQQLYNLKDAFGLPTDGMKVSDGWDSPTTKLKGHGLGHYLSALALAYANNGENKNNLLTRIRTIVDTMRECQERTFLWCDSLGRYYEARDLMPDSSLFKAQGTWDAFDKYKKDWKHYGYGYINAISPQHLVLVEAMRPYNNEKWVWAPYYTVHKIVAGLVDVATYVDDTTIAQKALLVAQDMGLWVWNRLYYRTTEELRTRMWNMYIAGEVGGMQEILARIAEMTDSIEIKQHLTDAAEFFNAPAFYTPLEHNIDEIRTRHANQHIPMIIGALRTGKYKVAANFWNLLQGRYCYSTGGVGNGEMFRQPYSQMISMMPNPNLNETCCAYNLAKLSRDLALQNPNDARYMDYYERLLSNQIVGSLASDRWAVTYHYAVGKNAVKPFGNETPQSSCCGGTGVENHVRYQEATYFTQGDTLWVNLYMPTKARWCEKELEISQECQWPAENIVLKVQGFKDSDCSKGSRVFVKVRIPYWATQGVKITLNDKKIASHPKPCSYVTVPITITNTAAKIHLTIPFTEHLYYGPDPIDGQWLATHMKGPMAMVQTSDGTFVPDYKCDGPGTHYLPVGKAPHHKGDVMKGALAEQIAIATKRWEDSEAWAPFGLKRMIAQIKEAEKLLTAPEVTQEQIDAMTTKLSSTLNTMRPSTLAEPEDVEPLQALIEKARKDGKVSKDAIEYAEMVVRYVLDGSGTPDMVEKALRILEP